MVRVLMTTDYSAFDPWAGTLFEAQGETVITRTDTSFIWQHPDFPISDFQDFQIRMTGTGFRYDASNNPTAGSITKIEVYDASNNLVLTIDQFSGNDIPSDLVQIVSDMFGATTLDGPRPSGKMAWSHILQGNDTIVGTAGNDWKLPGFMDGNDLFIMKGGTDHVYAGAGQDIIKGGAGYDFLTYDATTFNEGFSAFRGINVNMALGKIIDCWGFTDTIIGVEAVHGSRFNDIFRGSVEKDEFAGLRGRDVMNGGANSDLVVYDFDFDNGGSNGVYVDLQTSVVRGVVKGYATDGFGQRDTLISIENVNGTRFDDTLIGSRSANRLRGDEGDDTMTGGGGNDTFYFRRFEGIDSGDVITDFKVDGPSQDKMLFRISDFLGMTNEFKYQEGTDTTGSDATFVFDDNTSILYWDVDGAGGVAKVKLATLTGVTELTQEHFQFFA